jgi:hypothetical protein
VLGLITVRVLAVVGCDCEGSVVSELNTSYVSPDDHLIGPGSMCLLNAIGAVIRRVSVGIAIVYLVVQGTHRVYHSSDFRTLVNNLIMHS